MLLLLLSLLFELPQPLLQKQRLSLCRLGGPTGLDGSDLRFSK
jgi:hypothetical protein